MSKKKPNGNVVSNVLGTIILSADPFPACWSRSIVVLLVDRVYRKTHKKSISTLFGFLSAQMNIVFAEHIFCCARCTLFCVHTIYLRSYLLCTITTSFTYYLHVTTMYARCVRFSQPVVDYLTHYFLCAEKNCDFFLLPFISTFAICRWMWTRVW